MKPFISTLVLVLATLALTAQPGTLDPTFNPGSGANNEYVRRTLVQPDGKILVCGTFTQFNGQSKAYLVRLNPDGSLDETFNTGNGFNAAVVDIGLQSDGKIIAVGSFANFNGTPTERIARLNTSGTLDGSFNIGLGPNGSVARVLIDPSDRIYIAGNFTLFNGTFRTRIARLQPSGSLDNDFDSSVGPDGLVYAMALQPDGKLIIGGSFQNYNNTPAGRIARLTSTGAIDNSFNTGTGIVSNVVGVMSIDLHQDGKIIAGGKFDNFNGTTVSNLVRLLSNGQLDTQFTTAAINEQIESVFVLPSGKVIIAGRFTAIGSTSRNRVAGLNANGSINTEFNPGNGANSIVNHIAKFDQSKVMIGGYFTTYNGTSRGRVARINVEAVSGMPENENNVKLADCSWSDNTQTYSIKPRKDNKLEISILDINGHLIFRQSVSGESVIPLSGLKGGVYHCVLRDGSLLQTVRFIKL